MVDILNSVELIHGGYKPANITGGTTLYVCWLMLAHLTSSKYHMLCLSSVTPIEAYEATHIAILHHH